MKRPLVLVATIVGVVLVCLALLTLVLNAAIVRYEAFERPLRPTTALIEVQEKARAQAGYEDPDAYFEIIVRLPSFNGEVNVPSVDSNLVEFFVLYPESQWLEGGRSDELILEIWMPLSKFEGSSSVLVAFAGQEYLCTMPSGHSERSIRYANRWHRVSPIGFWLTSKGDAEAPQPVTHSLREDPEGTRYQSGSVVSYPSSSGGLYVSRRT